MLQINQPSSFVQSNQFVTKDLTDNSESCTLWPSLCLLLSSFDCVDIGDTAPLRYFSDLYPPNQKTLLSVILAKHKRLLCIKVEARLKYPSSYRRPNIDTKRGISDQLSEKEQYFVRRCRWLEALWISTCAPPLLITDSHIDGSEKYSSLTCEATDWGGPDRCILCTSTTLLNLVSNTLHTLFLLKAERPVKDLRDASLISLEAPNSCCLLSGSSSPSNPSVFSLL